MIHLSYYKLNKRLEADLFNQLLQTLPSFIQNKILRFKNWQDAQRSLAGNILLMKGLQSLGLTGYSLQDLKYTSFQKPYFDDTISFNIAHSGEYVVCAISETNQVGIDVEEIKEIPMDDFANLFASQEWEEVITANNRFHAFYTLWTKKEAFLKVIGCGLSQPLNEVVIQDNTIYWENKDWFLHEIKLDPRHILYICCDAPSPFVQAREIYL